MVSSPPLHTYRVYAAIAFSLPPSFFLFPSPLSLSLSACLFLSLPPSVSLALGFDAHVLRFFQVQNSKSL